MHGWMEGYLISVDIVRPFSFFIDRGYKNVKGNKRSVRED